MSDSVTRFLGDIRIGGDRWDEKKRARWTDFLRKISSFDVRALETANEFEKVIEARK